MLKKKWIIPMLIVLALILTSCTKKPKEEDEVPPDNLEENEDMEDNDLDDMDEDNEDEDLDDMDENETNDEDGNISMEDIKITAEEAYKKFTDKFSQAKVNKLELEKDKDSYRYEVEGYDDKNQYEIKINPIDGNILNEETDPKGDKKGEITLEDVKKVNSLVDKAKTDAGNDFTLDEWELKMEDEKLIFKIELKDKDNKEVEYKYDVKTEELIKKD